MAFCFACKIVFFNLPYTCLKLITFWQGAFGKRMQSGHAKCQTHIEYNDFLPVHRELLKDGIFCSSKFLIFNDIKLILLMSAKL